MLRVTMSVLAGLIAGACSGQLVVDKVPDDDTDPSADGGTSDSGHPTGAGDSGTAGDSTATGDLGDTGAVDGDTGNAGGPDGDSGTRNDTDMAAGTCAPPDAWTGPVDPQLYTHQPFAATYDAGLVDALHWCCGGTSTSAHLVVGATVVVAGNGPTYVADGQITLAVRPSFRTAPPVVGDIVSFGYHSVDHSSVVPSSTRLDGAQSAWFVSSSDNPVHVHDLGAATLQDDTGIARLTHAWGEIGARSNHDCGPNRACFVLEHQGVQDKVRVPNDNPFGLDPDYQGGLCAEVIAPGGRYRGFTGTAVFLDVVHESWMRVWPKP